RITDTYHSWREEASEYSDKPGFCRAVRQNELKKHEYVLTPGRYVGAPKPEDDGEPFKDKMDRLVKELREQQKESAKLDAEMAANLSKLGY
ncbi:MAG: N-6 DNA methylase, partial [Gammaproteobacteria bacterium]|nr:N-6 DNA methylase [Gammaproteobacteria bacterium]